MGGKKLTVEAERLLSQFGKRLEAVRIATGYKSHRDFSDDLGIDPLRYGHYARGRTLPPIDVLVKMSQMTGRTLDFLLTGNEAPTKRK